MVLPAKSNARLVKLEVSSISSVEVDGTGGGLIERFKIVVILR